MSLTPGSRLGPYEILSPLGAGGMGEVYRAHDTKLNRDVALKVLPDSFANDPDRLARFQREAQVLASLNHPNIAHIHGLEESGGVRALVMELVEGEDLAQRLTRGAIPIDEALPIAKQIAEALEAAHEQGIIHRDLKPANIKVTPDGRVKVLDFGLAKAMEPAGIAPNVSQSPTITTPLMTQAGMIIGTAPYMSPEQARGKAADKRSDLWAFGCVLYEMLTGTRAFEGEHVSDTLAAVLRGDPAWAVVPASVPQSIRTLMRGCLEKDRRQRFADISVAQFLLSDKASLTTNAGQDTSISRPVRWRGALPWALVGLATLVALGVSALYLREPRQTDTMVRFTIFPPIGATRTAGGRGTFAVSPDGQTLAFEGRSAGGMSVIFIRRLDAAEAQPLAGTNNASGPFWSPDSRSIGFFKSGGLYRTELDGNPPRRLCDVSGNTFLGGTWGTAGVIVFASSGVGLRRVPETGSTVSTAVTTLDASTKESSHTSPQFLPDGRHVLFLSRSDFSPGIIWSISIDESARTRIIDSSGGAAFVNGWLLYTTGTTPRDLVARRFDVTHLALGGDPQPLRDRLTGQTVLGLPGFSVSASGVLTVDRPPLVIQQLMWVDRGGRMLSTVGAPASIPDFALAPDGTRIVATKLDAGSLKRDLWLFDGRQEDGTQLTYQADTIRPLWASDGRHVYFRQSPARLRTISIGGANHAEDFENPGRLSNFEDATQDGRYVVISGAFPANTAWLQRVGDPSERRPLVQDQFEAFAPRVSPDRRWLAYVLNLPEGLEVFGQPFDRPGERTRISPRGGFGPIWREDSRELYYEGPDGMMAVSISEADGVMNAGPSQLLFPLHTQGRIPNFPHNVEVAEHGQKFLVNTVVGDSTNAPIEVTLNWTTGLKK